MGRDLLRMSAATAFLLLPIVVYGADLQKGLDAYDVGDYETSLAECQPLAEQGVAAAEFCVGRLYANGFGVPMDDALALHWYGLAAEHGHSEAQYNLGVMHANGWGVPMSDEAAAGFYRLAAEQGFVQAVVALAELCRRGMGVEQDIVEAYVWFDIGAQLGDWGAESKRDELASEMSPEELAVAEEQVQAKMAAFNKP